MQSPEKIFLSHFKNPDKIKNNWNPNTSDQHLSYNN